MNVVILAGNIGSDLDVKDFQNSSVANFSLATTKSVKIEGNWEDTTVWHNVRLWNRQGLRPYLTKGTQIIIKGELLYDEWKDEKSGQKKIKAFIEIDTLDFGKKKGQGTGNSGDGPY